MLTWWSDRALATSRSSRERSRATTSTPARNTAPERSPSQSTSIRRVAWSLISDTALAQSARCTLTPRPRVTKPMISSPGTGVQQLARRTSTSSRPSTWTPTLSDSRAVAARPQHGRRQLLVVVAAAEAPGDALGDAARRHVVLADRRQQRVEVDVAELGDHRLELVRRSTSAAPAGPRGGAPRRARRGPASIMSSAPLAAEPLADLVAGPRRRDEAQPVLRRPGGLDLRREDLARVAARQLVVERHQPAVDLGADAGVADLGVHGVGEVDRRRADRQRDRPAPSA